MHALGTLSCIWKMNTWHQVLNEHLWKTIADNLSDSKELSYCCRLLGDNIINRTSPPHTVSNYMSSLFYRKEAGGGMPLPECQVIAFHS